MTELTRSVTSFRRYGSSGLVWNDNPNQGVDNGSNEIMEVRKSQSVRSVPIFDRNKAEEQFYGMKKVASLPNGSSSTKAFSRLPIKGGSRIRNNKRNEHCTREESNRTITKMEEANLCLTAVTTSASDEFMKRYKLLTYLLFKFKYCMPIKFVLFHGFKKLKCWGH
ncbi:unnamed protein product [Lupinus luteus]|uniref:Uncharacterized protein n=1 Tax=Lupinus luteus TaxID=3873 RepID=A0AAV1Y185_LUPLU